MNVTIFVCAAVTALVVIFVASVSFVIGAAMAFREIEDTERLLRRLIKSHENNCIFLKEELYSIEDKISSFWDSDQIRCAILSAICYPTTNKGNNDHE